MNLQKQSILLCVQPEPTRLQVVCNFANDLITSVAHDIYMYIYGITLWNIIHRFRYVLEWTLCLHTILSTYNWVLVANHFFVCKSFTVLRMRFATWPTRLYIMCVWCNMHEVVSECGSIICATWTNSFTSRLQFCKWLDNQFGPCYMCIYGITPLWNITHRFRHILECHVFLPASNIGNWTNQSLVRAIWNEYGNSFSLLYYPITNEFW